MYKTESGKLFDTQEQANFTEAKELLTDKLNEIASREDVCDEERSGFVNIILDNTDEVKTLLEAYHKRVTDDLPF